MTRRDCLRLGVASATSLLALPVLAKSTPAQERALSLYNTHTGENVSAAYWAEGGYIRTGLQDINTLLRDHRSGEIHPIDTDLLDLLYVMQQQVGSRKAYQIISGYRSPQTNAELRNKGGGVARRSYHMQGMAIDIRLPGCDLSQLHKAALDIKAGGVGYYPGSDFIHVDVGPQRSW
ncbi:MAG: DUF882 domain-containing protein [Gammaproteobacteria bacterium]|nr:DUF882 domain-containing protein [Gammaproteobacteria bacterium]